MDWANKYASSIWLMAGTMFFIVSMVVWLNYAELPVKYEDVAVYVVLAAYGIQVWWAFTICPRECSQELKENYYAYYNYCWWAVVIFLFIANWCLVGYDFNGFDIHFRLPIIIILAGLIGWVVGAMMMLSTHRGAKFIVAGYITQTAGLGDEPCWNGYVVDNKNYRTPVYVFEDNTEGDALPAGKKPKRVIGYRISPTLVIHSMVGNNCWMKKDIKPFCVRYNGELLNRDDVQILRENWETVSNMRLAIGDTVLPMPRFWYNGPDGLTSAHFLAKNEDRDVSVACVIMKRHRLNKAN